MQDPRAANYGRARYGQIAPRQSAEYDAYQQQRRDPRLAALQGGGTAEAAQQQQETPAGVPSQEPPMRAALAAPPLAQRAQPRPAPPPSQGGGFGDMSQGRLQPMASQMAPPQGRPMSTHNQAYQQFRQLAAPQQQALQAPPQQPMAPPQQPDVMRNPAPQQPQQQQPFDPRAFNQGAQQAPPQGSPASSAYDEYLQEFGPDDAEQPMSYEQFEAVFSQVPPEVTQQLMGSAQQPQATPQFARQGFNGINLDMVGQQRSPMGLLGFNTERAFAGGDEKSMKDALARAFATNPVDLRGMSKQQVGAYLASPEFESHMAQTGLQKGVHWNVKPGEYDVIEVNSAERGWEPVDIVGNAGSGDAVWTYQALMDAQQGGGQNPMQTALMQGVDPNTGLPAGVQSPEGTSYWEEILAQLQRDMQMRDPQLFPASEEPRPWQ